MFAWSRTFYATYRGLYYCFDAKRDRDHAVKNHGFESVTATEAYKHYGQVIQVPWQIYERINKCKQ